MPAVKGAVNSWSPSQTLVREQVSFGFFPLKQITCQHVWASEVGKGNCGTIVFISPFTSIPSFFIARIARLKNSSSKAVIVAFNHPPCLKILLKIGRLNHHASFTHSATHPNCMFMWPTHLWVHVHTTKHYQKQLPAEEVRARTGDLVPLRLWHFYSSDWDFQKGNELSKSDYNSVWIGLLTSWVIFLKTSRPESATKAFAFFIPRFAFTFFITQVWSNIVLWQAVRAKLKRHFCYNPSLSDAHFPFSWHSQEAY